MGGECDDVGDGLDDFGVVVIFIEFDEILAGGLIDAEVVEDADEGVVALAEDLVEFDVSEAVALQCF